MKNTKKHWIAALAVFALCLVACKERDTHYEYYDKDNTKPHKVFEVDKATGKMDGSYKEFDKNGTLVLEGSFEDGMRNGTFKEYRKDGKIMVENTYKNDVVEGPVKAYNGEGKLVSKGEIRDGKYVHTKFFTDPRDGQKYPVVVIGARVWMAANLNYETEESRCFDDEESNCEIYGRLYSWDECSKMLRVGQIMTGVKMDMALMRLVFRLFPYFWSSTEDGHNEMYGEKLFYLSNDVGLDFPTYKKRTWLSVRCVKDE